MKSLTAPFIGANPDNNDISAISLLLDKFPPQLIDCFPWPGYKSETSLNFSIACSDSHILLKFRVKEKAIRAVNNTINSPVYEDSCVEFFIALDDIGYYNFEFNCIGAKLAAFGESRNNRQLLPVSAIKKIKTESVITSNEDSFFLWNLTISIPFGTFTHHRITDVRGKKYKANFFKCGDLLPAPHYMAWAPIESAVPDFHQPGYFGDLSF